MCPLVLSLGWSTYDRLTSLGSTHSHTNTGHWFTVWESGKDISIVTIQMVTSHVCILTPTASLLALNTSGHSTQGGACPSAGSVQSFLGAVVGSRVQWHGLAL